MIALGADHGGYELKEAIKKHLDENNIEYKDFGTNSTESTDYAPIAAKTARAVASGECERKNKKFCYFIITLITLIIVSFGFISFTFIIKHWNDRNKIEDNKTTIQIAKGLPQLNIINYLETPWLYDFVNSSIGWKIASVNDDNIITTGDTNSIFDHNMLIVPYYAIMFNEDKILENKTIFIEKYNIGRPLIRPPLGTLPAKAKLTYFEVENILSSLDTLKKENRYIKENEWTILIIEDEEKDWNGINLNKICDMTDGLCYNTIYDQGYGWPKDWISNKYWSEILYNDGYNLKNEFWQRYNVDSVFYFKTEEAEDNSLYNIKIKVIGIDSFKVVNFKNRGDVYLREDQLDEFLKSWKLIKQSFVYG